MEQVLSIGSIKTLISKITPLCRYNISDEIDQTLELIKADYPELVVKTFQTGEEIWDWKIDKKWELHSAKLKCRGEEVFTHLDHPIRVWSGSASIDKKLIFNDLQNHLHFSELVPNEIPWKYKYYHHTEDFWGFSLTKSEYENLDQNAEYEVEIKAELTDGQLSVGYLKLEGKTDKAIIISSDICHPGQANDSLSGVVNALLLYEKLKQTDNFYTYYFTFQTEMIGTMALLASGAIDKSLLQYGIFTEMIGHDGQIVLQHSHSKNTRIDQVALEVLLDKKPNQFECKDYLDRCIVNDELILNHVGIHIPSISFNREGFEYYHTNKDTFENLDFDKILEVHEICFDLLNRMDQRKYLVTEFERVPPRRSFANRFEKSSVKQDYKITPLFTGPIFLSKHGVYVDWQDDPDLNRAIEKIMINTNGVNTCSDIAEICGLSFDKVLDYLKKFEEKKLVRIEAI